MAEAALAWLEDVQIRTDLGAGTKELYRRELDSLVMPTFGRALLRDFYSPESSGLLVRPLNECGRGH